MIIERGGTNEERLYLHHDEFMLGYDRVVVTRTKMPDMENLIARHKARYLLAAFFCRPGIRVLDFPCGSGYGSRILTQADSLTKCRVYYEGRDNDAPTIKYCRRHEAGEFIVDDLKDPHLPSGMYDLIACIEGIEHIDQEYQRELIEAFYAALKPGGILVVSTPEKNEGKNPYHLHELTSLQFEILLREKFNNDVQILSHKETLHNGQVATCLYGICRK